MINLRKYLLKTKSMIVFETILLLLVIISYFFLKNIVVGFFFTLFIISILIWTLLLILTENLYNKLNTKLREKENEKGFKNTGKATL